MDDEIRFGELEEVSRGKRMRPDQNRHLPSCPARRRVAADLPIYVDVDVLRDMEAHALSNPDVELGGVLLGGQYEDEQGQPFVVITDSLRAAHYESTEGKFQIHARDVERYLAQAGRVSRTIRRWWAGTTRIPAGVCSCPAWTRSSANTSSTSRWTWLW